MVAAKKFGFQGASLKVKRAKQHINNANSLIKRFINLNPYEFIVEENSDGGEDLIIRLTESLPQFLPAIIGDAVHNLASALDHVMWELLLSQGGVPNKYLNFPHSSSADGYKSVRNRMIGFGFKEKTADILQGLDVYPGGKNELLWKLIQTDITDKHSVMLPTVGAANLGTVSATFQNGTQAVGGNFRFRKFDTNGRIRFVSLQEPGAKFQLQNDPQITIFVIFDEGMLFANQQIFGTLDGLAETVKSIVERFIYDNF